MNISKHTFIRLLFSDVFNVNYALKAIKRWGLLFLLTWCPVRTLAQFYLALNISLYFERLSNSGSAVYW